MSQFFQIHPETPQPRLVGQAVDILRGGGVVVWPTDSAYALGCRLGDKKAVERIKRIRQLDDRHNFTLMCRDLSDLGTYAKVDNSAYRLLKMLTPGAYTFILRATSEVPRRLMHPKRRSIGLRVPEHRVAQALLEAMGEPLMSTTLILPGDDLPLTDPYEIRQLLEHAVDLVIDGGWCGTDTTSVLDLVDEQPVILRRGVGDLSAFE